MARHYVKRPGGLIFPPAAIILNIIVRLNLAKTPLYPLLIELARIIHADLV
jgi:hypothetical protein